MRRKSKRIVCNQLDIGNVGKAINHLDSQVIATCFFLRWVLICLNKANNKIRDGNYNDTLPTNLNYIRYTDKGTYAIRAFSPPRMKQIAILAIFVITAFMAPSIISELGLSGYVLAAEDIAWRFVEQFLNGLGVTLP